MMVRDFTTYPAPDVVGGGILFSFKIFAALQTPFAVVQLGVYDLSWPPTSCLLEKHRLWPLMCFLPWLLTFVLLASINSEDLLPLTLCIRL